MLRKNLRPIHILYTALTIAVIIVLYFVITVFSARDRDVFVTPPTDTAPPSQHDVPAETPDVPITHNDLDPQSIVEQEPQDTVPPATTSPSTAYINITPPDCARECEPYKHDAKELRYCRNACGLSSSDSITHCDAHNGLPKDYCLKDRAIAQKDITICDEIDDGGIKKTCITRLQQEFIESL